MPARRLLLIALRLLGSRASYPALTELVGSSAKRVRALVLEAERRGEVVRTTIGQRVELTLTPGAVAEVDNALRAAKAANTRIAANV